MFKIALVTLFAFFISWLVVYTTQRRFSGIMNFIKNYGIQIVLSVILGLGSLFVIVQLF